MPQQSPVVSPLQLCEAEKGMAEYYFPLQLCEAEKGMAESLFCSEASFVARSEFARYENKSHPKQSLYLAVTQRSPEETRLLFYVL